MSQNDVRKLAAVLAVLVNVPGCVPSTGSGQGGAATDNGATGDDPTGDASTGDPTHDNGTPDNDAPGDGGMGTHPEDAYFPEGSIWYEDVSEAPLDPQSDEVIAWLDDNGGWGGGRMQIDFSIEVLEAGANDPVRAFNPTEDWFDPDCDIAAIPIPAVGALEGERGYECASDGDCHLIVVDRHAGLLYEMWRANIVDKGFDGGCLALWDMRRVYPADGRGENCTSADAAGFPIAPLLFSADEVAAGSVPHAIRFILPNSRIRNGVYVHPATHSTGATSGPASAPAYGARLRLRANYPLESLPNDGARVVARALQSYGMFLSDGGTITLTAQSDQFTVTKWDGLLGPHDLTDLQVTDFELVDGGERIPYTGDCARNPQRFSPIPEPRASARAITPNRGYC